MGVYIKGMEMPKNCLECKIRAYDAYAGEEYCPFSQMECLSIGIQGNCPLAEVPEPHGRLIDADALVPDICHDWNGWCVPSDDYSEECIRKAPTVIETEGE